MLNRFARAIQLTYWRLHVNLVLLGPNFYSTAKNKELC